MEPEDSQGEGQGGAQGAAPGDERGEHPGCTLGIFIGLLVTAGAIASLGAGLFGKGRAAPDAAEYAQSVFRSGHPPYGLEPDSGHWTAAGERILEYRRGIATEASADAGERARPDELVLVEFSSIEQARAKFLTGVSSDGDGDGRGRGRGGESDSATREASANLSRWQANPDFAWHTTLEAGPVSWRRWRADYRIERSFREGGTWRDSARVDLCQEGRPLLLFAQWPEGEEASLEGLQELLSHVELLQ